MEADQLLAFWSSNNTMASSRFLSVAKNARVALVAYIIKIENLPTFSGEKTDMLIGFSVVGLAKNTLWVVNLSNF